MFNKSTPKVESPEFLQLVNKWDSFLARMEQRFEESLINAEQALLENLDESNYDMASTLQAWSGIKSQILKLADKIETTFDEKVQPQMLAYKEQWELIEESQKGILLGESFSQKITRFEIVLEGKISQQFYDHAIKLLNKEFNCTQCGAQLEINKDIFRSHFVSCDYCNTVNTFKANSKIAEIKGFAIDNIARYTCLPEWDQLEKTRKALSEITDRDAENNKNRYIESFNKLEAAEKNYWSLFFTERANHLPEYKKTIEHDIAVKMKFFYEERQRKLGY